MSSKYFDLNCTTISKKHNKSNSKKKEKKEKNHNNLLSKTLKITPEKILFNEKDNKMIKIDLSNSNIINNDKTNYEFDDSIKKSNIKKKFLSIQYLQNTYEKDVIKKNELPNKNSIKDIQFREFRNKILDKMNKLNKNITLFHKDIDINNTKDVEEAKNYQIKKYRHLLAFKINFERELEVKKVKKTKIIQIWWKNQILPKLRKIKKIIKIQSMFRGYISRKNINDIICLTVLYQNFIDKINHVLVSYVRKNYFPIHFCKEIYIYQKKIEQLNHIYNIRIKNERINKTTLLSKYFNKWKLFKIIFQNQQKEKINNFTNLTKKIMLKFKKNIFFDKIKEKKHRYDKANASKKLLNLYKNLERKQFENAFYKWRNINNKIKQREKGYKLIYKTLSKAFSYQKLKQVLIPIITNFYRKTYSKYFFDKLKQFFFHNTSYNYQIIQNKEGTPIICKFKFTRSIHAPKEKNEKDKEINLQKLIELEYFKYKSKAYEIMKKYILLKCEPRLIKKSYLFIWIRNAKYIIINENAKIIQEFCRSNLELRFFKKSVNRWRNLSRKIFYKSRMIILKMQTGINLKQKKICELLQKTQKHKISAIRKFLHYIIMFWHLYTKKIHKKRENMKFLYENLLKTYMSLADDIFGYNQNENPSVQDVLYEAVNSNKFISMLDDDDVPLAKQHYEQIKKMKSDDSKNKGKYGSGKKMVKSYTTSKMEILKEEKIDEIENFENYLPKFKSDNKNSSAEQSIKNVEIKNFDNKFEQQKESDFGGGYNKYKKTGIIKDNKEIKNIGNYSGIKKDRKIDDKKI